MTKLVIDGSEASSSSKKPTVGQVALDLMKKDTVAISPIDQMEESLSEYEQNVFECAGRGIKMFPQDDFYVLVITKNERLLANTFRQYFFPRRSCPTPDWDQAVYRYKHKGNQLVFMWVIPSKVTCEHLTENANYIVREEQQLLKYVLAFNNGTLLDLAKELNGEKKGSVELQDFTWKG